MLINSGCINLIKTIVQMSSLKISFGIFNLIAKFCTFILKFLNLNLATITSSSTESALLVHIQWKLSSTTLQSIFNSYLIQAKHRPGLFCVGDVPTDRMGLLLDHRILTRFRLAPNATWVTLSRMLISSKSITGQKLVNTLGHGL